ncbi:MAG TPA: xanthine dehydrogenase family protein subunit M [Candidatus Binatia bacterium]|jgi:carbon-monoxide dehydrogenase medium subunit
MIPAEFEYFVPATFKEALDLLSTYKDDAKILAGGQSLVPLMKLRLARPRYVIDIGRIADMNDIRLEDESIRIGALATHAQVEHSELVQKDSPLLSQAAATIGDVQVRNQGTIGGSLAHADPTADLPAVILALEAELKAVGPGGERWIKAEDFFVGFFTSSLEPDEILTEIKIPVSQGSKTAYLKAAQRASGFAVVGVAVRLKISKNELCDEIAIGLTGVSDKAFRARAAEVVLGGKKLEEPLLEQAAAKVTDGVDPLEDINGSKEYRSHLARVYTVRAIRAALAL